jgi:hypothetical protein
VVYGFVVFGDLNPLNTRPPGRRIKRQPQPQRAQNHFELIIL